MNDKKDRPKKVFDSLPEHARVLVVDDSPVVRATVGSYLREAGFEVREAENGAQALRSLDAEPFDVVVTDLRMPELDGFGVLEAVKKRGPNGPEVILLTGTHAKDVSSAIRALRLGAHDFLAKPPSSPDEVVLTVDRAVEKKRLREANTRLLEQLAALSRTDSLTGVLNRGAFDEALRREATRSIRYHVPLSLVMLDIDEFKGVNDTHGHHVGDEVIKAFVRLAATIFRESDTVHRYGGDEFAVLLPHTPYIGAIDAARRLCIETARTPVKIGALQILITISAGVSSVEGNDRDGMDLVTRADAALYDAKRAGRNRAAGNPPATT